MFHVFSIVCNQETTLWLYDMWHASTRTIGHQGLSGSRWVKSIWNRWARFNHEWELWAELGVSLFMLNQHWKNNVSNAKWKNWGFAGTKGKSKADPAMSHGHILPNIQKAMSGIVWDQILPEYFARINKWPSNHHTLLAVPSMALVLQFASSPARIGAWRTIADFKYSSTKHVIYCFVKPCQSCK